MTEAYSRRMPAASSTDTETAPELLAPMSTALSAEYHTVSRPFASITFPPGRAFYKSNSTCVCAARCYRTTTTTYHDPFLWPT